MEASTLQHAPGPPAIHHPSSEPHTTSPIHIQPSNSNYNTHSLTDATSPEQVGRPSKHSMREEAMQARRKSLQQAVVKGVFTRPPFEVPFPAVVKKNAHTNYIRTTKYTVLSFLPMNLLFQVLYQLILLDLYVVIEPSCISRNFPSMHCYSAIIFRFRRFYNIYFLLGALSVIGGYSSLSYISQIMPLAVVLAFSAAKDGIEDFNRYLADRAANNIVFRVIRGGKIVEILSMNIQPGDLLYMTKGEKSPVDAMILSTSYEDGTGFVDTAELDGETNLKRRTATNDLCHFQTSNTATNLSGVIHCEHPNANLMSFEGRITVQIPNIGEKIVPLTMNNLILRGAVLRNTEHAIVIVIYTGKNTKIIQNLKNTGLKSSTLEARLNWLIVCAFIFNAFLLVTSVLFDYWHFLWGVNKEAITKLTDADYAAEWYIGPRNVGTTTHLIGTTIGFFSLYTYVIPISLFVTLELTRLAQAHYMTKDPKMTYEYVERDGSIVKIPMKTNNSNLNEDLGCIEYIFSDKTGTLTQNSMRMAQWWCDNVILDEMAELGVLLRAINDHNNYSHTTRDMMLRFAFSLGVCHGVIPAVDEHTGEMIYESQSPDETALLITARNNGVKLLTRTKAHMKLEILGQEKTIEILNVLEFNSARKRMSIIIRTERGIELHCKGADNIIFSRLSADKDKNPTLLLHNAQQALDGFSNIGLRTLVITSKIMSQEEYDSFLVEYQIAERSLQNREEMIEAACDQVERDLCLLGCTAIEDRLQDQVPETIEYLLKAGIKLWLLTGDKQETAINIGMSSRLINTSMRLIVLTASSSREAELEMDKYVKEMHEAPEKTYALVINGDVLTHALAGPHKQKLLQIGTKCRSVICTRVTPLQKAMVVRLVRSNLKSAVTLAIGDGANDVSMIQAAHVGVGIMGKEGTQAVRAADFAFGEFRFLERLLSVHGRYNYLRMANLIFYSFYKNIAFITVQWWFGFFNAWSAQVVMEEVFFISFNVVFTSLPPLAYAIYECDVDEDQIEKHPQLYREVRKGMYWNAYKIFSWFFTALLHSVFIFGSAYLTNFEGAVDINGKSTGYWVQCYLFSTPLLISVLVKLAVMTRHWVWPIWFTIVFSMGLNISVMFIVTLLESFFYSDFETAIITHALPAYYLLSLLMPALCNLPDVIGLYFRSMLLPSDADIMMEESKLKKRTQRSASKRDGLVHIDNEGAHSK
ncbi:hypothetical protein BDEG_26551 [Batrachochytrium dendrobatidis JEL423]|uniref:Phospholipid-transporting ATPase n=1 Tax=Batrachochytrium dendrobatidis (strain JEL423) TaxID=403673 RepID=A0A177WUU3_BATDL|nr:hypothetical protein BDEG_26551 [Batrachochytrium dendrobatidis JEL423]